MSKTIRVRVFWYACVFVCLCACVLWACIFVCLFVVFVNVSSMLCSTVLVSTSGGRSGMMVLLPFFDWKSVRCAELASVDCPSSASKAVHRVTEFVHGAACARMGATGGCETVNLARS